MFIGGLVFAAVITAYAYNGDTNIFTFIGLCIFLSQLELLDCNCPHVLPIPSFVFYAFCHVNYIHAIIKS
jgi:hypothetical protein